jgi:hypothetical protein
MSPVPSLSTRAAFVWDRSRTVVRNKRGWPVQQADAAMLDVVSTAFTAANDLVRLL